MRTSTESYGDVSSDEADSSASIHLNSLLDTAYFVDDFLYASHIVFATIGIPLNLLLIGIIVVLRRLRLPRNFNWIGIGLSNICILISQLMVDVSVRWRSSSLIRSILFWIAILSNAAQSISFLLALLERHISITHPNWHKNYVTIAWIIAVQIGCSFFIFLLGTIHIQIFEEFRSQYFNSSNFTIIGTVTLGIFSIFLFGQLAAMRIKPLIHPLPYSTQLQPKFLEKGKGSSENHQKRKSFFLLIGDNQVSQLELEAFQSVLMMGKIYFMFMVAMLTSFGCVAVCLQQSHTVAALLTGDAVQCSTTIQVFYYIAGSLSIHSALVNPAILVVFSSDLTSVWKSFKSRRFYAPESHVRNGFDEQSDAPQFADTYV